MLETLEKIVRNERLEYQGYVYTIYSILFGSENDQYAGYIRELEKLLQDKDYSKFHEVIQYMIKNNMILEQEALDIT